MQKEKCNFCNAEAMEYIDGCRACVKCLKRYNSALKKLETFYICGLCGLPVNGAESADYYGKHYHDLPNKKCRGFILTFPKFYGDRKGAEEEVVRYFRSILKKYLSPSSPGK